MIRFVPDKNSFTGRALARLGKLLGLRSETVYSRAIVLTALAFLLLGAVSVGGVWYVMVRQFDMADMAEARATAGAVKDFLARRVAPGDPLQGNSALSEAGGLTGRTVSYRASAGDSFAALETIIVQKAPGGIVEASFPAPHGIGEITVSGRRSFYETGIEIARMLLAGFAVAGGVALLLILFIVDRTVLTRVQLLADKVESEKRSERLPVKLDVQGEDEIAQLASSIEDLARLLQSAEREYRSVVEDQTESICRFDAEWRITFSNRAFEALCVHVPAGSRPELSHSLDSETLGRIRGSLDSLTRESPVTSFSHAMNRTGADPVWYRSTLRANFDSGGRRTGGQWIAADVTSEMLAQRKLQESQQQLQLLSGRLMTMQDEERRRIARDLHDSTAQALSALEMNTSLLESMSGDEATRRIAAETGAISRQVCSELRNISYLLHPPLLEEEGLVFAIRWFADGFTKRNNIPVLLDVPDDFPRLATDVETALFRIVQEALGNIYRHAGATKAWITVQRGADGNIFLEVRDNGEGLPDGFSFAKSAGVGLAGMRERMKRLGGSLVVDSSPYGVSVKCRLEKSGE